jgi:hypothetical protein
MLNFLQQQPFPFSSLFLLPAFFLLARCCVLLRASTKKCKSLWVHMHVQRNNQFRKQSASAAESHPNMLQHNMTA